ncbi:hypothetical protein PN836_002775 [Ningiella sp. W23]|uniref:hypothetical protein n=1 Tax=Ningiella sp. W23 TaxID=3023715 RepID=UPI00375698D8
MSVKSAFLALCIFCVSTSIRAQEVLVMTDSHAFIEQVSTNNGVGTISSVYDLLYQRIGLPKNLAYVPLNRQNRLLELGEEPLCTLYRFKTKEREQRYFFSKPIYFLLHYKLYQQSDLPPLPSEILNEDGELISLNALADALPDSTFLLLPEFSYGNVLDPQIDALPNQSTLTWSGNEAHNRLSVLFLSRRGDFALMFPSEVFALGKVNPQLRYRSYSVAGVPSATFGYMMCTKHEATQRYIEEVNAAMSEIYRSDDYLNAHFDFNRASERDTIIKSHAILMEMVSSNH